ncbi:MAG: hypothetical protein GJ676_09220 [Rhodobacteraceae bacterium]|nr:hypothetical protein [Paracoccaceae bacterium]
MAAILPAWTQASEAVQEILRDYDEVCQQLAKPETGPELERDLRRIRKELISELARATGDPAGDNCSVGSSQKEEKNSDF